jgi:hypothetical protein
MSVLASKNSLKSINLHLKKSFMKFCNNNKPCVNLNIVYGDKITKVVGTTSALGLQIDYTFRWTMHNKSTDILLSDQYCLPFPVSLLNIAESGSDHPHALE